MVGTTDAEIPEKIKAKHGIIDYKGIGSHFDGERGNIREYIVLRERQDSNHNYFTHFMIWPERGRISFNWGNYFEDLDDAKRDFDERR